MSENVYKNPEISQSHKSWEQQPGESDKAFEAFRVYLEMGKSRSLAAVAQQLSKSIQLTKKWSGRWKWPLRVRKHTASLIQKTEKKMEREAEQQVIPIMTSMEILGRTSFFARATLDDVLDDEGKFSIQKARQTGAIHALKKIRVRKFTRRYRDGTIDETVNYDIELRDPKHTGLDLLGKHHGLWTEGWEDPLEKLARLMGVRKELLPARIDPDELASVVEKINAEGQVVEQE